MLFFPPPPPTTTDLVVNPTVDGLLLNGALMPMPSLLEQEQRNQEVCKGRGSKNVEIEEKNKKNWWDEKGQK